MLGNLFRQKTGVVLRRRAGDWHMYVIGAFAGCCRRLLHLARAPPPSSSSRAFAKRRKRRRNEPSPFSELERRRLADRFR